MTLECNGCGWTILEMKQLRRAQSLVLAARGQGGRLGLLSCLLLADWVPYSWKSPALLQCLLHPHWCLAEGMANCLLFMQKQALLTSHTQVPVHGGFGWVSDEICLLCPLPDPHHLLAPWLQILLATPSCLVLLSCCLSFGGSSPWSARQLVEREKDCPCLAVLRLSYCGGTPLLTSSWWPRTSASRMSRFYRSLDDFWLLLPWVDVACEHSSWWHCSPCSSLDSKGS